MLAAKASVILQLMQIFTANAESFVYWSFLSLLGLNGAFYFSIFVAFILACLPRTNLTDPSLPGTCISNNGYVLATSVFKIVLDLSILILHLVVVWSLRKRLKRKLTVGAVFGTGIFIIRLAYTVRLTLAEDVAHAIFPVDPWALLELTSVIMVG
ncbi:39cccb01-2799-4dd1-9868-3c5e47bc85e7 [Sclerotinia trifoliorum]|uniref:39cccb01-2799-4dd1-9868-3c5e47bc85e7 n=1 Tax=Sclerotinia trifoliorum TaxID=28548 RepID=A0A8H2VQZ7_9HELO|nr:39cccb01-2799-4dd1-9868-3c5e47bc85e7 [Sclerotinia trifoliorum]